MIKTQNIIKSIHLHSNIEEIFAYGKIQLQLSNSYDKAQKLCVRFLLSPLCYINNIFYKYGGKGYYVNDLMNSQAQDTNKIHSPVDISVTSHDGGVTLLQIENIIPEQDLIIDINTTEILNKKLFYYEYILPDISLIDNSDEDQNSYEKCDYKYEISVNSKYVINNFFCSNQNALHHKVSDRHYVVSSFTNISNPVIIRYELAGKPDSMIFTSAVKDINYFLIEYSFGLKNQADVSLNEFFILYDISENISQPEMDFQKQILIRFLKSIRPTDKFNILLYSAKYDLFSNISLQVNNNISNVLEFLNLATASGMADIQMAFKYASEISVPLGYDRTYIILSGGSEVYESRISKLSTYIMLNRCFMLLTGDAGNRSFAYKISKKYSGEYFFINDYKESYHFINNFYSLLSVKSVSEIGFDFGDNDIIELNYHDFGAIPCYKTLCVAGTSREKINGLPMVRSVIDNIEYDKQCSDMIEIDDGTPFRDLIHKPDITKETSYNRKENDTRQKPTQINSSVFFDDTEESINELTIANYQQRGKISYAVFADTKEIQNAINAYFDVSMNYIKEALLNLLRKGLPGRGVLSFELQQNTNKTYELKNLNAVFNQIEYDTFLYDELYDRISYMIYGYRHQDIDQSGVIFCVIEYDLK